jgi:hypothetical protein
MTDLIDARHKHNSQPNEYNHLEASTLNSGKSLVRDYGVIPDGCIEAHVEAIVSRNQSNRSKLFAPETFLTWK